MNLSTNVSLKKSREDLLIIFKYSQITFFSCYTFVPKIGGLPKTRDMFYCIKLYVYGLQNIVSRNILEHNSLECNISTIDCARIGNPVIFFSFYPTFILMGLGRRIAS